MANMSYCRFENTFKALQDCYENLDDRDLSESEEEYKIKLIRICNVISDQCGDLL